MEPGSKAGPQPVIIVGHGLAGLVAAYELTQRGVRVVMVDQENANSVGGQAFWSLGGLFFVNSPKQRSLGIKDSRELAMRDWFGTAKFDSDGHDDWPRQWAKAFVDFATDDFADYVGSKGLSILSVGWAERGDGTDSGHGNSVPRFNLSWGTGPEVVRIFREPVEKSGLVEFRFRHMVDAIITDPDTGRAVGIRGSILKDDDAPRGVATSREVVDAFELRGSAILVSSGGIGGNLAAVRAAWPTDTLGPAPKHILTGVPAHVDGRMLGISAAAGAHIINESRMWHYTEGVKNWNPIWPNHGIRIIPGPSSLWLDAAGKRLPPPLFPGCDTTATLKYICNSGFDYTWFILDKAIVAREFSLSGSEQNPDVTSKSLWQVIKNRLFSRNGPVPVQNFVEHGEDFVVRDTVEDLVAGMNELAKQRDGPVLDADEVRAVIQARDDQMTNHYSKDAQAMLVNNARLYGPEKWLRVAAPHKILDKAHGPLIAVRINIISRKTLGGIETNLDSNVMREDKTPLPGLYAAGEVAGFGGGGAHGQSALEGTFLGGAIHSGMRAGRAMAQEVLGGQQ